MKKIILTSFTIIFLNSCGLIITCYPSLDSRYSKFKREECILTESFYLSEEQNSKYYNAYPTKSTSGNFPYTLEKGTKIKVNSIYIVDNGFSFRHREAICEYFHVEENKKIKFYLNLDAIDFIPFTLLKEKNL